MTNRRDAWDTLELVIYSDASYEVPHSTSGWAAFLMGPNGSSYLIDWQSKKQSVTATSTTEAELLALAHATKNAMRLAVMIEQARTGPLKITILVDNEAVRHAVTRGHSHKLAHMRKHASVSLLFLQKAGVTIERVNTKENFADIFTKGLPKPSLDFHLRRLTGTND